MTARSLLRRIPAHYDSPEFTLASRVGDVLALHYKDESYACGHCQTRGKCETMRTLDGENK